MSQTKRFRICLQTGHVTVIVTRLERAKAQLGLFFAIANSNKLEGRRRCYTSGCPTYGDKDKIFVHGVEFNFPVFFFSARFVCMINKPKFISRI